MIKRLPDPEPGGSGPLPEPVATPAAQGSDPSKPLEAPKAQAPQAPPPAAEIVLAGAKTERELALERDLESERQTRKDRETRVSQLEDENRRLKTPSDPKDAKGKRGWLSGATFFDEDE